MRIPTCGWSRHCPPRPYKLTLSTEQMFLSAINNQQTRIDFQLDSTKKLVLCVLRNKRAIVREGPG